MELLEWANQLYYCILEDKLILLTTVDLSFVKRCTHWRNVISYKFIFLKHHEAWTKWFRQIPYFLFLSCKHIDAKFEIYEVNIGNW